MLYISINKKVIELWVKKNIKNTNNQYGIR